MSGKQRLSIFSISVFSAAIAIIGGLIFSYFNQSYTLVKKQSTSSYGESKNTLGTEIRVKK